MRTANVAWNLEAWRKMPVLILPAALIGRMSFVTTIYRSKHPTGVDGERHDALFTVALRVFTREHDRGLYEMTDIRVASVRSAPHALNATHQLALSIHHIGPDFPPLRRLFERVPVNGRQVRSEGGQPDDARVAVRRRAFPDLQSREE